MSRCAAGNNKDQDQAETDAGSPQGRGAPTTGFSTPRVGGRARLPCPLWRVGSEHDSLRRRSSPPRLGRQSTAPDGPRGTGTGKRGRLAPSQWRIACSRCTSTSEQLDPAGRQAAPAKAQALSRTRCASFETVPTSLIERCRRRSPTRWARSRPPAGVPLVDEARRRRSRRTR